VTINNSISTQGDIKTEYCYAVLHPFEVTFCYTFDNDNSCNIVVDDENCNRCQLVDIEDSGLDYSYFECLDFDCSNTIAQLSGNECLGAYVRDGVFSVDADSTLPPEIPKNGTLTPNTFFPSLEPSSVSTAPESESPTMLPSQQPTPTISSSPSLAPTVIPTLIPSVPLSDQLSPIPSELPTSLPSSVQTIEATLSPSPGLTEPNPMPNTILPTSDPSDSFTAAPSDVLASSCVSRRSRYWIFSTLVVLAASFVHHIFE